MLRILFIASIVRAHMSFTNRDTLFNHLVVDYNTDAVYVGTVNYIYELTAELKVVRKVTTGPVADSVECSFNCDIQSDQKDNYNKALVIDYARDRLITCGSVFQGMCTVRNLKNIYLSHDVLRPVVANDPTASTVMFIAPGPTTQVMYTGVTYTNNFAHRYDLPAVSSRSLEDASLFDIAKKFCEFCHTDQVKGTKLHINNMYLDEFRVDYVYGFSSGSFSYLLTTQPKPGGGRHSKIIRICQRDELYNSYTEIPVSCNDKTRNVNYTIAVGGHVATSHANLAQQLGTSPDQDVLYAVFHHEGNVNTTFVSALCMISIEEIDKKIGEGIEKCFGGEGMRGSEHVLPNRHCVKHDLGVKGADFCGSNVNTPLGIDVPITIIPSNIFPMNATGVAVKALPGCTKAYVGSVGGVMQLNLVSPTDGQHQFTFVLVMGSPVNKDMIFDTMQRNLYVMTEHQVFRLKVALFCGGNITV